MAVAIDSPGFRRHTGQTPGEFRQTHQRGRR
jgi:hypothetical protein